MAETALPRTQASGTGPSAVRPAGDARVAHAAALSGTVPDGGSHATRSVVLAP